MTKNDLKYAIKEIVYEMLDDNTCVNCGSLVDENLRKWFKDKWVNIGKKNKDGSHPPCGTSGKKRAYAKCVPASKARGMTKKQKAKTLLVEREQHKIKQVEVVNNQQDKVRHQ